MKINFKKLLINIIVPVGLGALVGLLTSPSSSYKVMIMNTRMLYQYLILN